MLCDPEPLNPRISPQSSSIRHAPFGATYRSIGPGAPDPSPGVSAWPRKYVEYGMPEQNETFPFSSQPLSTLTAGSLSGAATDAQMKRPPSNTSSCASCGNHEPTMSAWFDASARHHAVDGQPRAISTNTCMKVGTSTS